MNWLRVTGLVAFWAILGGAVDVLLVREMDFASRSLAMRYAATSGLLWATFCVPSGLALGWLTFRAAGRRHDPRAQLAAAVTAQVCAVLLPWTLVALLLVHKNLPRWIPATSLKGLALTAAILLAALALGIAASRVGRRSPTAGFVHLSVAGWLLTLGCGLLIAFGQPSAAGSISDRPNLLLISIDSLRRDVFDEYVSQHASPALRGFVAGSRRYRHAHTTYSHSLPSHASMFTGLYPPKHGAMIFRAQGDRLGSPLSDGVQTVAGILREEGYETSAVLSNPWIGAPFGLEAGFDTYANTGRVTRVGYFDLRLAINLSMAGPYVRYLDARLLRTVHPNARIFLDWLRVRDPSRPFFAFLHFIEMHTPNDPPERYRKRFVSGPLAQLSGTEVQLRMENEGFSPGDLPEVRSHLRNLHLAALAQMDEFLQPVLEELTTRGWLENTLVCVVSDHGENLYERGGTYGKSHVYHTSSEVPFLIHVPGEEHGSERSDLVSVVDIAATLYGFAGVSAPARMDGVDLLAASERGSREWIYVQGWDVPNGEQARAVIFGDGHKWLRDGLRRDELYQLRSDPLEESNLFDVSDERSAKLRKRFDRILDELGETANTPLGVNEIPESVTEQLRTLGYLE